MKIIDLPFNKLIGLSESNDDGYILKLNEDIKYTNHIGTVHASALYALAEGTCGEFLLRNFPEYKDVLIPVVRKCELKYKKPATGQINSIANIIEDTKAAIEEQLKTRNRAIIKLKVDLFDMQKVNVMTADFEWFISKMDR